MRIVVRSGEHYIEVEEKLCLMSMPYAPHQKAGRIDATRRPFGKRSSG